MDQGREFVLYVPPPAPPAASVGAFPDEGPSAPFVLADTDAIRAAGDVGHIRHLGFGNFEWLGVDGEKPLRVEFRRFVDRAGDCMSIPPAWVDQWCGRVHTLQGDWEILCDMLVGRWTKPPQRIFSLEGGSGYMAKRWERKQAE